MIKVSYLQILKLTSFFAKNNPIIKFGNNDENINEHLF